MAPKKITRRHVRTFALLADAFFHGTLKEDSVLWNDSIDTDAISDYDRPSKIPGFGSSIQEYVECHSQEVIDSFALLMNILDSYLAPLLTGTFTTVRDMSLAQREQVLISWRDSPFAIKKRIFRLFYGLSVMALGESSANISNRVNKYPGKDFEKFLSEVQTSDLFKYPMEEKPRQQDATIRLSDIDVLVIGSGAGAGVVTHTLSEQGFTTLVLEKSKYYHISDENVDQVNANKALYEEGGAISSSNGQIFVQSGSTFGGGTTVNWSASLKTPFKVRNEWYQDFGIDWAAKEEFDKATDFVFKTMGCSTENINHSFGNRVILDGAAKLGYEAKEVPQNHGGYPLEDEGYTFEGIRYGTKQGSVAKWFKDAQRKGSKFMDQVSVQRIIHKNGVATAVLCKNTETGNLFTMTGFKKIAVCGGALNTPVVLQRSGFKNKHIGAHLKLHPSTAVYGDFGKEVDTEAYKHPILTTVCTQVDDVDGKAHGAKIETIYHTPSIYSAFTPWNGSKFHNRAMTRYTHVAPILLITRDTSEGTITYDKDKPDCKKVEYSINAFDLRALKEAFLIASDLLYIEGAKVIVHPQIGSPSFTSDKPKSERTIKDADYHKWRREVSKINFELYKVSYASAHQMSSCRMSGKGPGYGACDPKGRLFECKNVYIADASALPTASGVNPMVSVMSVARLVANGIAKELKPGAKL